MVKAYKIKYDGSYLFTYLAQDVCYECLNWDDDMPIFELQQIESMQIGDTITEGDWTVEYIEVPEGFIESLPEHDGW